MRSSDFFSILKMNGAGNKILVLDRRGSLDLPTPDEARRLAARPELDYDQLMVLTDTRRADAAVFMTIYNRDGSLSGACGNGSRCVAAVLARSGIDEPFKMESSAGLIEAYAESALSYTIDMGAPILDWQRIPLARECDTRAVDLRGESLGRIDLPLAVCVNMGNPHAVFFVPDRNAERLANIGALLENHPLFPEKANISFAHVVNRSEIILNVWERGVGLTLACGTAACATLVAGVQRDLTDHKARVVLPGGVLTIEWRKSDGHIWMTGPVVFEKAYRVERSTFALEETALDGNGWGVQDWSGADMLKAMP